jgi:hypothetical protein
LTAAALTDLITEIESLLTDAKEVARDGELLAAELSRSIDGIVRTQTSAIQGCIVDIETRLVEIKERAAA